MVDLKILLDSGSMNLFLQEQFSSTYIYITRAKMCGCILSCWSLCSRAVFSGKSGGGNSSLTVDILAVYHHILYQRNILLVYCDTNN